MSRSGRARLARRVSLPSAGQTMVNLRLHRVEDGGPWPLTRVLTAMASLEVERVGTARAVGDRRGTPLIHSQELLWREQQLYLEARHGTADGDELMLELPGWDELTVDTAESDVWMLIDCVAATSDARFGSIGDGEPPETELPETAEELRRQVRRHIGLLLPAWSVEDLLPDTAAVHQVLDRSGLLVVLR